MPWPVLVSPGLVMQRSKSFGLAGNQAGKIDNSRLYSERYRPVIANQLIVIHATPE
jgi:hypothetical protein